MRLHRHDILSMTYRRPTHVSYVAHTPPARISAEYSYTRPLQSLTPRFDYKINPYMSAVREQDELDAVERRCHRLARSNSAGLANYLSRPTGDAARQNLYPSADYKKDSVGHGRQRFSQL